MSDLTGLSDHLSRTRISIELKKSGTGLSGNDLVSRVDNPSVGQRYSRRNIRIRKGGRDFSRLQVKRLNYGVKPIYVRENSSIIDMLTIPAPNRAHQMLVCGD